MTGAQLIDALKLKFRVKHDVALIKHLGIFESCDSGVEEPALRHAAPSG